MDASGRVRAGGVGGAARWGGRLARGAGRFAWPLALGMGAVDFLGTDGTIGERTQNAISGATFGIIPRAETAGERATIGEQRASRFTDAGAQERRLQDLRQQLGQRHRIGAGPQGPGRLGGYTLTGKERRRAQAEADALKLALPGSRTQRAEGTFGQMQGVMDVMQTGNAAQRRTGRGQVAKMYSEEFRRAGPEGRRALSNATGQWIDQLSKGNRSQRRLARTLRREVTDSWKGMGRDIEIVNGEVLGGSKKEWNNIKNALQDPVEQARQSVSTNFTKMQEKAIGSLTAMGYSRAEAKRLIRNADATTTDPTGTTATASRAQTGAKRTGDTGMKLARGGRIAGTGLPTRCRSRRATWPRRVS